MNLLYDPKLCKFQSMVIYILSIETCTFYLKLKSHGNVLHSVYVLCADHALDPVTPTVSGIPGREDV